MTRLKWIAIFCLISCIPVNAFSQIQIIKPGIIIDGTGPTSGAMLKSLKSELSSLMPGKVRFNDSLILNADWRFKHATEHFQYLEQHTDVNLIITLGVLSSGAAVENKRFAKPTLAVGIVEPEIQGLAQPENNRSGTHNFTYILFNQSLKRDLNVFHDVYPYKKVGLVLDSNVINAVVKNADPIELLTAKREAGFVLVGLENSIKDALDRSHEFDAAYVAHLGRFEGTEKEELISGLAQKGIPAFGASLKDIHSGVLASISPEQSMVKVVRRIALNVESLLDGVNFSNMPVNIDFKEQLTINLKAARDIGFSPKFSILAKANVVNELAETSIGAMDLEEVVARVIEKNLDLSIAKDDILLAEQDLDLAQSGYYPTVSASTTYTIIDEHRAEMSGGQQARRTASGSIGMEQVLFSDDLATRVDLSKALMTAGLESYDALVLDTIYTAADAYFTVLKAKTQAIIQKKNLELTNHHLVIAKHRQAAGHSGLSDVYRWQSAIAKATSGLFEAMSGYKQSRINLNRLMNQPLDTDIVIRDESLTGNLFKTYSNIDEFDYIDNPATFEKFIEFLIVLALDDAPEIREIEANLTGLERQYLNYQKKRYLPTAALAAEAGHVFSRGGEGADVPGAGVEDDQWSLSINLSWPLFTGGSTTINKVRTKQQISQLKKKMDNLVLGIEAGVRSAALDVTNKYIDLESSKESDLYAQKSLDLVQDSYAKGRVAISDLIDAQNDALNAQLGALNSAYEYLLSVFNLERATGRYRLFSTPEQKLEYEKRLKSFMDIKQQ